MEAYVRSQKAKLTVLVDLDDVLGGLGEAWVKALNKKHGTSVKRSDVVDWEIEKFFPDISTDEVYAPLFTKKFWESVKPVEGAVKYLKKIIKDGHKVYVVTASHPDTIPLKLNHMLFKHFPYLSYKDVIVAHDKHMIKGDILIDDAPHNFSQTGLIYILMTAPHNKKYKDEREDVVRVHSWEEAYGMVDGVSIIKTALRQ